ncbi:hypothetical protein GTP91_11390 [Rugamonas sp. FT82W]|uniref:HTH luxR-type domain-containing protein n=1 Tax=Duganella vulcania TaxID=2692166 RepID=A0A845FZ68_9BURK|nr:hypothetical protein [Duganella vulcania]
MNLLPHTVESYRTNIKQKMGIASGSELYRLPFVLIMLNVNRSLFAAG